MNQQVSKSFQGSFSTHTWALWQQKSKEQHGESWINVFQPQPQGVFSRSNKACLMLRKCHLEITAITRCGEKERFSAAETMAPIEPNGPSMSHLVILQFHTRRSLSSEHCWQSIECFGQAGLVKWPNWENCLVPALAHCNLWKQ